MACFSVEPKRSSSARTTRAMDGACARSSGYAPAIRSTTAAVSSLRNAPSRPSLRPWRSARRMILRRT